MVYYKSKKEHRKIYSLLPKKEKKSRISHSRCGKTVTIVWVCVCVEGGGGWGVTMYMAHQFTVL